MGVGDQVLLSMTGFGAAQRESERLTLAVEVRALNHRHLKINIKGLDVYTALESRIEQLTREVIRRGSVQILLRIERIPGVEDYVLNTTAMLSYWQQLEQLQQQIGKDVGLSLGDLLVMRGVVNEEAPVADDVEDAWRVIRPAMQQALDNLQSMRRDEGQRMCEELAAHCRSISGRLDTIQRQAPEVVKDYRVRLQQRVNALLDRADIEVSPNDLIKELSIFAERSDVSEELVRHRSHLEQFEATLQAPASEGRKLEFLSQEMVREVNTIGSKANDVLIAREVVEIKGLIDRIRELVQNVE